MTTFPTVRADLIIKFLHEQGFRETRQKGSHKFFRHPDGRTCVVPFHKGEDLGHGILRKILNDAEYSKTDFAAWLQG
ncbi:MAG: type II toxin-antitoxin system HicA family toxin [Nitrospirae bacterium]|nr:type II toxin-antitoxin system HicA family toxin [Nitrospirota bacterium]